MPSEREQIEKLLKKNGPRRLARLEIERLIQQRVDAAVAEKEEELIALYKEATGHVSTVITARAIIAIYQHDRKKLEQIADVLGLPRSAINDPGNTLADYAKMNKDNAAAYFAQLDAAVQAERGRCAKTCEKLGAMGEHATPFEKPFSDCAAAIRSGEKPLDSSKSKE